MDRHFRFDWASESPEEFAAEMFTLLNHGLGVRIVELVGSGGGWPDVEVTGTPDRVFEAMKDFGYSMDDLLEVHMER